MNTTTVNVVSNHRLGDVTKPASTGTGKIDMRAIIDLAHDVCDAVAGSGVTMSIGRSGETVMLFHPDHLGRRAVQLYLMNGIARICVVDVGRTVHTGTYPMGLAYPNKAVQEYVDDYPSHIMAFLKGHTDELIAKDRWSEGGLNNA